MFLMDSVEFLILRNLLHNEEYVRKVIPFMKADYFEDLTQKIVFEEIFGFVDTYNKPATKEILYIEAEKRSGYAVLLITRRNVSILNFINRHTLNKMGTSKGPKL